MEKVRENAQADIPEAMIQDEAEYMLRDMAMRMSYQGFSMEDYMKYTNTTRESLLAMQKPEAKNRVMNELVLEAIRKEEKIEPTEEEIDQEVVRQAEAMGRDAEEFRKDLTEEQKDYLKQSAAIRKVLDLLKATAVVEEKPEEAPAKKEDAE